MATSSDEDVPRDLARAQCLAYLACLPRLLDTRCNSIGEMELINALCRRRVRKPERLQA
jgi:hypothetical protein